MEGPTFSVQIRHGDEGDNTPNNGGGLEVDLGTILGSRYRATKYHLIRYIEKKCDTENVFVTPLLKIWNFSSKGMILINTPGVEIIRREAQGEQNSLLASHDDSPTSIEIINGTGSSSRPEHRTMMRHSACRDLVQMNLVLLQDILRKVEAKVKPEAIRAQITFWIMYVPSLVFPRVFWVTPHPLPTITRVLKTVRKYGLIAAATSVLSSDTPMENY